MSARWWDPNASFRGTKRSAAVIPSGPEALTLGAQLGDDGCRGGPAPRILGGHRYLVAHPGRDSGVAGLGGKVCFSCRGASLAQGFKGHGVPQDSSSRLRIAQSLRGKAHLFLCSDEQRLQKAEHAKPGVSRQAARFQPCSWRKVGSAVPEPNISPAFKQPYYQEGDLCAGPRFAHPRWIPGGAAATAPSDAGRRWERVISQGCPRSIAPTQGLSLPPLSGELSLQGHFFFFLFLFCSNSKEVIYSDSVTCWTTARTS